jgi:EmrB/QacA subfamily drug resistance transporter
MNRTRLGWTLAVTSGAFFMVCLDALVVITALPAMHRDLGAGFSTLQWTVNAYGITYAAGIITAAALGDRLGRRRVFASGLGLFTLASAACALAPGAPALIAARAVQGLGAAVVMPLSLTILAGAFPAERRGAIVGLWGGIAGLAVATGPLIGGAVTQGLDWHWIFWVNVPLGVAATLLSLVRLPESRTAAARLDLPGLALVSAGALGLVWGLVRGNDAGWASAETLIALGGGTLLLGAFVGWERRASQPMLPLRLFRIPAFAAGNAAAFLMMGGLFAAAFLVSQWLQLARGYSPLDTGVRLLPWTVTPMLVSPLAGKLVDRIGARPLITVGLVLQAVGLGWIAIGASQTLGYPELVAAFLVAGVGISMALPAVPTAVLGAVAPGDIGTASGTNSTMQRFGTVFGIAITSAVFAANGRLGGPAAVTAGFRPALAVAAGLSLLAAAIALAIPKLRAGRVGELRPVEA